MPKKNERYDREKTEIEKGLADLREEYSPAQIIIGAVVLLFVSNIISGLMMENIKKVLGMQKYIYLSGILTGGFTNPVGIIITVAMAAGGLKFIFWMMRRVKKDYHTDRERNYDISNIHAYGDADFQDEKERERCFYRTEDPLKVTHNLDILGVGIDDGLIYAMRDDLVSMNKHMMVMGSSGAGKSATLVKNQLYQNFLRGDSVIVTDSKGDLYADTAYLAHKHGYVVKVLNLKSDQLMNSDGCDFLKTLGNDDVKAGTLAETIIKNTEGDESLDYWAKNELNLCKALLLYVANDPSLIKTKKNKLAHMYTLISTKSLDELHEMFEMIKDDQNPAKQAFNLFAQCDPKVQGQIVNGLGIRLQVLSNKWARHVVSDDEIDLVLPMKKKCIYYVVISDTETTYKFIATLFFSSLFIELCGYFDKISQRCRTKGIKNPCLPVNFILDEFANTGSIPAFDVKIATVRSRQIGITTIIQNIGQLIGMYDENVADTILNNMSIKMLLKTSDFNTAKYFSDIMGIQTVMVKNRKYEKNATDIVDTHDGYSVTEGMGKRPLMNPDELINSLDNNHEIVCISGFHPVKLKKFLHSKHPMADECKTVDPGAHYPKWRKDIDKKRKEKGLGPIYVPDDSIDIELGIKKEKTPVKKTGNKKSQNSPKNENKTQKGTSTQKTQKNPNKKPQSSKSDDSKKKSSKNGGYVFEETDVS